MCLNSVKKIYTGKSTKVQTGYKLFTHGLYGTVENHCRSGVYGLREWYEASNTSYIDNKNKPIKAADGTLYPPGFHIFTSKAAVKAYFGTTKFSGDETLRKVYYKGLLARGIDSQADVVIAKYMSVGKPRKEKKCSTTTQRQKASY